MDDKQLVYRSYMIHLSALFGICSAHIKGYECRNPIAQAI